MEDFIVINISLIRTFEFIMLVAILIVHMLTFIINIGLLKNACRYGHAQHYVVLSHAVLSALIFVAFTIPLIYSIGGISIITTSYGSIVIRPLIFITGCVLYSTAYTSKTLLEYEQERD